MNAFKLSFLTCLFVVFAIFGYSQVRLGLVGPVVVDHDTINCAQGGTGVNITVSVINSGNISYSGGVFIAALYNGDTNQYVLASRNLTNFNPNDVTDFTFFDPIQYPFVGGDNIIIVWPQSPSADVLATQDSGTVNIHVIDCPLDVIKPNSIDDRINFSPNPVNSSLMLSYPERKDLFESVRIFDLTGKELQTILQPESVINLENLPAGMYLLHVKFSDGVEGTMRLVKE